MTLILSNVITRSASLVLQSFSRQSTFKTILVVPGHHSGKFYSKFSPSLWIRQILLARSRQPTTIFRHDNFLRNGRIRSLHSVRKKSFIKDAVQETSNKTKNNEWDEMLKLSLIKRMHVMFKKYWYIAIPFHCINSALWFAGCFLLAKFGIDGAKLINYIKPYIQNSQICPDYIKGVVEKDADKLGHLAVALILYKLLTPGRYAATVFGTVFLLRYLLQRGVFVRTAAELSETVRHSYLSHAVSKNVQKQRIRLKRMARQMKKTK